MRLGIFAPFIRLIKIRPGSRTHERLSQIQFVSGAARCGNVLCYKMKRSSKLFLMFNEIWEIGEITLKTLVFAGSLKLRGVKPGQCLDGWMLANGHTGKCKQYTTMENIFRLQINYNWVINHKKISSNKYWLNLG